MRDLLRIVNDNFQFLGCGTPLSVAERPRVARAVAGPAHWLSQWVDGANAPRAFSYSGVATAPHSLGTSPLGHSSRRATAHWPLRRIYFPWGRRRTRARPCCGRRPTDLTAGRLPPPSGSAGRWRPGATLISRGHCLRRTEGRRLNPPECQAGMWWPLRLRERTFITSDFRLRTRRIKNKPSPRGKPAHPCTAHPSRASQIIFLAGSRDPRDRLPQPTQ